MIDNNTATKKRIGRQIRALRLRAEYSSYETFASDHEIPRKTYWRLEAGHNFTIDTLLRVLNIHKITIEDFFAELKERQKQNIKKSPPSDGD